MATLGLSEADRKSIEKFETEVIQPSMTSLVILDFWAEWCGPCKQLGPILDEVAAEYAAKGVRLAKVDVDADKLIATQFRIQSIPTVYAIYQGQPVADLTTHRTKAQLTKALDQLLAQLKFEPEGVAPTPDIQPIADAAEKVLEEGDAAEAAALFGTAHDMAPGDPGAAGGLARALIAAGRIDEARALLDGLDDGMQAKPEVARARAALDLASTPAVDIGPLERRIADNPDDHEARFGLAQALMAEGKRDPAADALLEIVARDRDWNKGEARQRFLQLLEAQGLEDPWSGQQRRRLSAVLFT